MGTKTKLALWFTFGIACLCCYYYLHYSETVATFLEKSNRQSADTVFAVNAIFGLLNYSLLILGLLLPVFVLIVVGKIARSKRN